MDILRDLCNIAVMTYTLSLKGCSIVAVIVGLFSIKWLSQMMVDETRQSSCRFDRGSATCQLQCPPEYFSLGGMDKCAPYLTCQQIREEVKLQGTIGAGAVKMVKLGTWHGFKVSVSQLANKLYRSDFQHGLTMLQQLQSAVNVTQLVGYCAEEDVFVTEFYPLGSAEKFESVLQLNTYHNLDTVSTRFRFCRQYVWILHTLHTSPLGVRVMCDTNDITKTLSQFLVREDLSLVLNDLDALPQVDKRRGRLVKCGHRELTGDFVAPEQLWPFDDREFNDEEMPGYDEKVDIWKVPDVCDTFIGGVEGGNKLRLHLLPIHMQCKLASSAERPTALEIAEFYEQVSNKINLDPS